MGRYPLWFDLLRFSCLAGVLLGAVVLCVS